MYRNHGAALSLALFAAALCANAMAGDDGAARAGMQLANDPSGVLGTLNLNGRMRTDGPFFQSLGTNGRSCASCHVAQEAFSFTPAGARARFNQSHGRDPIFTPVDGANCPTLQQDDRAAHTLLMQNGLIRVGITLPTTKPEFTISVVHDPYGCAIIPDPNGGPPSVSVYRRPLPSTNLMFLSTVMYDGRETHQPLSNGQTFYDNLIADLSQQAIDATTGHAQASKPPSASQVQGIVDFELGLVTAQLRDDQAGELASRRALGGPFTLANQDYFPGINDSLGGDPTGQAFNPVAMTLFAGWTDAGRRDNGDGARAEARRAIAAGEALFDSAPMQITNVRGLNDNAAIGSPQSFVGHCTSCHDTPNVGNHSMPVPLDIGTAHSTRPSMESDPTLAAALRELSMPDLPVYLVNGCPNPFAPGEPESFYTTDPGKALISGLCSDFNRIKGPILRGLAARAPYFHNGAAADLHEVVNFYNVRFSMHLTEQQKSDLAAFLNSL